MREVGVGLGRSLCGKAGQAMGAVVRLPELQAFRDERAWLG